MDWLPPGWSSTYSKSKNLVYYYKGEHVQWDPPNWDDEVASAYSIFQKAEPAIKPFRSLQNYIKNCILFNYIFSNNTIQSIIDIACGKGGDVHKIPSTYSYLGIDICDASLDEAKKRHPSKEFIKASFNSRMNHIKKYDSAMCMFALHYGGDYFLNTLKNIRLTLNKDAIFVFIVLDEEKIDTYSHGFGPLQILKTDIRTKIKYRAHRRIWIRMAGVAQSTPEFILDKELIYETANDAGFQVCEHASVLQCLKQIGVGSVLDPTSNEYKIRTFSENIMEYYKNDRKTWDGLVWSFADMYKVIVLKAI
jgi:SAM-dependent methyltransferase